MRTYFTSVRYLFSSDGHIANCTVRYPGVRRPFSSIVSLYYGIINKLVSTGVTLHHGDPGLFVCITFLWKRNTKSRINIEANRPTYLLGNLIYIKIF